MFCEVKQPCSKARSISKFIRVTLVVIETMQIHYKQMTFQNHLMKSQIFPNAVSHDSLKCQDRRPWPKPVAEAHAYLKPMAETCGRSPWPKPMAEDHGRSP